MNKILVKLVIGIILLGFPSFVKIMFESVNGTEVNTNSQLGQAANNIAHLVSGMIDLMSAFGYISGIFVFMLAAIELKKLMEEVPNETMNFIGQDKESKEEIFENKVIEIKKEKIDFEDKELNNLMNAIIVKNNILKNNSLVQKDIESFYMVEKTELEYLPKIYNNFVIIPKEKRHQLFQKNDPYSLTLSQLQLLLKGLNSIEDKTVELNIMNQQANEIFLKQKVGSI